MSYSHLTVASLLFRTFSNYLMSKSSITPYVGASTGGLLATIATGGGTIGIVGAGGAFALPFLPVLGVLGVAGWAIGQAIDAFQEPAATPSKVVNVTPVTEVTQTIEPIRTVMSSAMQDDVLDSDRF